jgi:hypothetical protein
MSLCELFLEEVVKDARVLARVRNKGVFGEFEVSGEVGEGSENVGFDGEGFEEASELKDCDRELIGTVRSLRPLLGIRRSSAVVGGDIWYSSSGGT